MCKAENAKLLVISHRKNSIKNLTLNLKILITIIMEIYSTAIKSSNLV